jgi:hypothetical protein
VKLLDFDGRQQVFSRSWGCCGKKWIPHLQHITKHCTTWAHIGFPQWSPRNHRATDTKVHCICYLTLYRKTCPLWSQNLKKGSLAPSHIYWDGCYQKERKYKIASIGQGMGKLEVWGTVDENTIWCSSCG